MTEDTKPFTVKDRRHLSASGELREEAASGEAAPGAPAPAPEGAQPISDTPRHYPADFADLLVSLGAQAASFLGSEPPDLNGARAFISLLEALEDKSEGRRTPEEEQLLKGLLFELRMSFVARGRSSPP